MIYMSRTEGVSRVRWRRNISFDLGSGLIYVVPRELGPGEEGSVRIVRFQSMVTSHQNEYKELTMTK